MIVDYFYTDANGEKQGPIKEQQLRKLAAQGIIKPDTLLETTGGHKGTAGQIPGMRFNTTNPNPFSVTEEAAQARLEAETSAIVAEVAAEKEANATMRAAAAIKAAAEKRAAEALKSAEAMNAIAEQAERKLHQFSARNTTKGNRLFSETVIGILVMLVIGGVIGAIAWGMMGNRGKTPPTEVVVQVAPQPVIVEQVVPPAPPQPAYQSPFKDIFEAAANGTSQDVEYFIKSGVNVNVRSDVYHSKTPLFLAAEHNPNIEVVKYLVSRGADVNAKTHTLEHTLLHFAVQNPNLEIVRYFVSQGADVNAKNTAGYAPIHEVARHNPNVEVLKYLVSQGANVNTRNDGGATPLHLAAEGHPRNVDNVEAVRYLVSQGADVNARNNNGGTPLDSARDRKYTRIVTYLESVGAKSGK